MVDIRDLKFSVFKNKVVVYQKFMILYLLVMLLLMLFRYRLQSAS
jgi:hypothetical protein